MKKILLLFIILFFQNSYSQALGYNAELSAILSSNHTARLMSNFKQKDSWRRAKESHEEVEKNMLKVMAVKKQLYNAMSNISMGMVQGKQLLFINEEIKKLPEDLKELRKAWKAESISSIVLRTKVISEMTSLILESSHEIVNSLFKINSTLLLDHYARQQILDNIQRNVFLIRIRVKAFTTLITNYNKLNWLQKTTTLNNYINKDKEMFRSIQRGLKYIEN